MNLIRVSLKEFTSLHIGGDVSMVETIHEEELMEAIQFAKKNGLRLHILGEGTNTFFGDELENLLVVRICFKGIKQSEVINNNNVLLTIAAGENWDDVIKFSVERSLWGIENLSLIPGTAGAAPVQNIGAYGVELKDVLTKVRVYDTRSEVVKELHNSECDFAYRDSVFKHHPGRYIILSIEIKLSLEANPILTYKPLDTLLNKRNISTQDVRDLVVLTRTTKLPDYKKYPNAGSFFKNAVIDENKAKELKNIYPDIPLHQTQGGYKLPTAWLIEHVAEMKGLRIGNIGTWPSQPLALVNYGNGKAEELLQFSETIIKKVYDKTGILLEREVNFVT